MTVSKQLILIRHGETEWNRARRLNSRTDLPLSDDGARGIVELAEEMKLLNIDHLYSSPQHRAMQTAAILAANHDCTVVPDDRLREVDFGRFEGLSAEQLEEGNRSADFDEWVRGGMTESAEPLEEAVRRARSFFATVEELSGTIVVVGHGYLLRILLVACVLELPANCFRRLKIDNASLSVVTWIGNNRTPQLVLLNGKKSLCLGQYWSDTRAEFDKVFTSV
jgi:broad specificity phosphatase PhoE